jgi:hypothetical protein
MKQGAGQRTSDQGRPNRERQDHPLVLLERFELNPRAPGKEHKAEHAVEQETAEVQLAEDRVLRAEFRDDAGALETQEHEAHDQREQHQADAGLQPKIALVHDPEERGQNEQDGDD